MMDELQGQHALKGLTRQEVIELLGEPTPTEYFSDWDIVYVLGPTPIFPIDFEWLIIRLDENGRVSEYHQVSD